MLTAELVRGRRKGNELMVSPLSGKTLQRARQLAEAFLALTATSVGYTYEQLREQWQTVSVGAREKKLADGLLKLIEDRCELQTETELDPRQLRGEVFLEAARLRRERGAAFDRQEALSLVAQRHDVDAASVDEALFADLKSQRRLLSAPGVDADVLVEAYQMSQYQAVLLRAVRVVAHVVSKQPGVYRDLFRALKFRRLLFSIHREAEGYRIEIDGPFSLFESVTKYGLQLALVFPTLLSCEKVTLSATVRWGKARTPLNFNYEHKRARTTAPAAPAADELVALMDGLTRLAPELEVQAASEILDLPGVGVCVADLRVADGDRVVFVELLGFWSRDAVWKRIEMVQQGLPYRVLFALSERLRVSEAALGEHESAALYCYKGVLSPREVLKKIRVLLDATL